MTGYRYFIIPILVSALATFMVRALPYYASFLDRLPRFLSRSLRLLPIAALGPLVFPGVIIDYPEHWYAGLCGIIVAGIIAYCQRSLILPIIASIVVTYLMLLL